MSDVVWKLSSDGQNLPYNHLFEALGTGLILGGSATSFSMKDGPAVVIFHGSFTVVNGTITAGTISGFQVFHNNPADQLMDVTGYSINFQAFKQAVTDYKQGDPLEILHLLLNPPLTVHGANQLTLEFLVGGFRDDLVYGNGGPDFIGDEGGSDFIYGGSGDDRIDDDLEDLGGIPGNDFLFGGDGADVINGGSGRDFLSGGSGQDELDGGEDSDTADYSEKLDTVAVTLNGPNDVEVLVGGLAEDTIRKVENINGGTANDRLVGDELNNQLVGNAGDDKLIGSDGNDALFGSDGRDKVSGGKGDDRVGGGLGKDLLLGRKGGDTFVFDTALDAQDNVDRVKKFSHAKDTIELALAVFPELDPGVLKGKHFRLGEEAKDGNDHVIYDDGKLSYDPDGKGGAKAILFAKVIGDDDIAANDFFLI